jgi:hypothetical protein
VKLHQLASIVLVETRDAPAASVAPSDAGALPASRSGDARELPAEADPPDRGNQFGRGRRAMTPGRPPRPPARRRGESAECCPQRSPSCREEEHRRTLRDRPKQVAELTQSVRTNHVAIVLR